MLSLPNPEFSAEDRRALLALARSRNAPITCATPGVNSLGYIIFGIFALTWAIALAIWRLGRIEQRWAAGIGEPS